MQVVNKTHLKTYSEPDQHHYQVNLVEEETHPIRESQSVTIYNRHKKPMPKLVTKYTQYTFTGTVQQSVSTIIKFTQKTIKQYRQKEKVSFGENLLSSMKESNHVGFSFIEKIKTLQPAPIKLRTPTQMVCKWWQKMFSNQQNQNQQQTTGQRDEDDLHNQIII